MFCFAPPDSVSGLRARDREHRDRGDNGARAAEKNVRRPHHHSPNTVSSLRLLRLYSTRDVAFRQNLPLDENSASAVNGGATGARSGRVDWRSCEATLVPRHGENKRVPLHVRCLLSETKRTRTRKKHERRTQARPGVGDGVPVHESTVSVLRQVSRDACHLHPVHGARRRKEPHENLSVGNDSGRRDDVVVHHHDLLLVSTARGIHP